MVSETDSLLVVNCFNNRKQPPWVYFELWEDIIRFSEHLDFLIKHIYIEGNFLADGLANVGAVGVDGFFTSVVMLPKQLVGVYVLDKCNFPSFRCR